MAFQSEHDVLNLDIASALVIFNKDNKYYALQATKSGQLVILDRTSGKPIETYIEKIFYHSEDKVYTKKNFLKLVAISRNNF